MEFEFMTAGTPLPPCMPLPPVLLRLPTSSTAKVMYARMLDEALAYGIEDENGILYIHFPIKELAAALVFPKSRAGENARKTPLLRDRTAERINQ